MADLDDLKRRLERLPAREQMALAALLIVDGKDDLGWVIAENAVEAWKLERLLGTLGQGGH